MAIVELALRCAGKGGYPAFIREVGKLPDGETLCIVEPAAFKPYFFANPARPGYANQSSFTMPKPPGVVRIFLVGESAAKGYPQPRNLSMSAFLEDLLNRAWTNKTAEVINLGTTAVASFPLVYLVRELPRFAPDLVIFYMGNNEFYGAYGTGSLDASGTLPPWALRTMRALRGWALTQALGAWLHGHPKADRTLMEEMIGRAGIPPQSSLREAAARNLTTHIELMLDTLQAAGVPALVCSTASNEADLAPLGEDDLSGLDSATQQELAGLLRAAETCIATNPAAAATLLQRACALAPEHARARHLLGRACGTAGHREEARTAWLAARDLDTMPWRPTSMIEDALRQTTARRKVPLCDIAETFRQMSPMGAAGGDLLDDHVHLSLVGQAQAARLMAAAMAEMPEPLRTSADAIQAQNETDADWARRLGANPYDEYAVVHTLCNLFGVGFMKRSNPGAYARVVMRRQQAEARLSPALLQTAREWQTERPHAGALRPLTGMLARTLLRERQPAAAMPLYEIAIRQVPPYTSWRLEYVYFALACQEALKGRLSEAHRQQALDAIRQGEFLLKYGESRTGLTERYMGRLHQLRGEWAAAIPLLLRARDRMRDEDRVACDQALVMSYIRTGQPDLARGAIAQGLQENARFAEVYRQLRTQTEQPPRGTPQPRHN